MPYERKENKNRICVYLKELGFNFYQIATSLESGDTANIRRVYARDRLRYLQDFIKKIKEIDIKKLEEETKKVGSDAK